MPDGKVKNFQWTPIVRSGETVQKLSGSGPYAAVHDVSGGYVYKQDTSGAKTTTQDISTHPDYTSLLTYEGTMYSITQFERPLPGSAWISELSQSKSGSLSIVKAAPVDFSSVGGIWIPCAGSVTPWGSHLGSEEYEPDAVSPLPFKACTSNGGRRGIIVPRDQHSTHLVPVPSSCAHMLFGSTKLLLGS